MTPALLLTSIEDALTAAITEAGGSVDVSEGPEATIEKLKVTPSRWRLIIQDGGFQAVDDYGTIVRSTVHLIIQAKKSMLAQRVQIHRGALPFMAMVELVARLARRIIWKVTEDSVDYHAPDVERYGLRVIAGDHLTLDTADKVGWLAYDLTCEILYAWDPEPES